MRTTLRVKVVPKASSNEIVGWVGDLLKVRVTAAPERGKANDAVLDTIALALKVPRSTVCLLAGSTRERKIIGIAGLTEAGLRARLSELVAG